MLCASLQRSLCHTFRITKSFSVSFLGASARRVAHSPCLCLLHCSSLPILSHRRQSPHAHKGA